MRYVEYVCIIIIIQLECLKGSAKEWWVHVCGRLKRQGGSRVHNREGRLLSGVSTGVLYRSFSYLRTTLHE